MKDSDQNFQAQWKGIAIAIFHLVVSISNFFICQVNTHQLKKYTSELTRKTL